MKAYQTTSFWGRAAAVGGAGALLFTVGCGVSPNAGVTAQSLAAGQPPVVVSCEPNQRTFVRPSMVNGVAVSQVECVSTGQMDMSAQGIPVPTAAAPIAYRYDAPRVVQIPQGERTDARVIRSSYPEQSSYPATVARPVRTRQVVYDDSPVRQTEEVSRGRSVKKSAIIIGSSAGVGAGVGAAVGGKKGALIGAAIGGGGAAIWDQVTRRKN